MEELFQNEALQEQLDQDGVVAIPFLNPEELAELRAFYKEMHPDGEVPQMRDGIHMTIWCSDYDYKVRIRERLREILQPALDRVYKDFRVVSPVFIVKRKGEDTTFPIHQDWNVVDETKHRAFNMWIPLQDVDASNGALWIVKGSHRLPNTVRAAGYLFPDLYGLEEHLQPRMEAMAIPAGHALVFYHRVIHGSPPNQNQIPRAVVAVSVLPEEVPLHIYFQPDAEHNLEVYHPSDDFIYEYENVRDDSPFVSPVGEPVAVLPPYSRVKLKPKDFARMSGEKKNLWQRLFGG